MQGQHLHKAQKTEPERDADRGVAEKSIKQQLSQLRAATRRLQASTTVLEASTQELRADFQAIRSQQQQIAVQMAKVQKTESEREAIHGGAEGTIKQQLIQLKAAARQRLPASARELGTTLQELWAAAQATMSQQQQMAVSQRQRAGIKRQNWAVLHDGAHTSYRSRRRGLQVVQSQSLSFHDCSQAVCSAQPMYRS